MKIRFLTFAQREIDEAYLWFEEKSAGRGVEFLDEMDRAVRLVTAYPLASPEIEPGVRRCIFAHFPYALLYGLENDTPLSSSQSPMPTAGLTTGLIESKVPPQNFRHKPLFAVFLI